MHKPVVMIYAREGSVTVYPFPMFRFPEDPMRKYSMETLRFHSSGLPEQAMEIQLDQRFHCYHLTHNQQQQYLHLPQQQNKCLSDS